jgi:hypothetical protein
MLMVAKIYLLKEPCDKCENEDATKLMYGDEVF